MQISIAKDFDSLQRMLLSLAREGRNVALVPTMGALHEGHLTLIREAKTMADAVVVSIFVNPTQFGQGEDFHKYPRMLEQDVAKAQRAGAEIVYAPSPEDMYPEGFSTRITVGALADELCGKFRPGHFDGVATVVSKLLLRVMPIVAVFGEKDYQQLCVIRRMVEDLDIPVDIVGVSTIREEDGLAMSSRNAYLSESERQIATQVYATLTETADTLIKGMASTTALAAGIAKLEGLGYKVDYLELRDAETLAPVATIDEPARLLVAAWLGHTRLIDNIAVE